jgi:hypothetical protein
MIVWSFRCYNQVKRLFSAVDSSNRVRRRVTSQQISRCVRGGVFMSNLHRNAVPDGSYEEGAANEFDINRASLRDKDLFQPFDVKDTFPLKEALAKGEVRGETAIVLIESDGCFLALLTHQMNYHHVAQGEMDGRPWLVSF